MGLIEILVVLVLLSVLFGSYPMWGYNAGWGYGPFGVVLLLVIIVLVFGSVGRVRAGTLDETIAQCARLYTLRNNFFHERGLCFTRPGALKIYPDNPYTCRYKSSRDLPLSASEAATLKQIVSRERALGCEMVRP